MGSVFSCTKSNAVTSIVVAVVAFVACMFSETKPAFGADFCVNNPTCESNGGAAVSGSSNGEKLQKAFSQTGSNTTEDRVFIGPGTYKTSENNNNTYIYNSGEKVEIIGSGLTGSQATIIESDTPGKKALFVGANLNNVSNSKISGLTVDINADGADGIWLLNGSKADGITVTSNQNAASNTDDSIGIYVTGDVGATDISNAKIRMSGPGANGNYSMGIASDFLSPKINITDTAISNANYGVSFDGVPAAVPPDVDLRRLNIKDVTQGVLFKGQMVGSLSDSLIEATAGIVAVSYGTNTPTEIDLRRITVLTSAVGVKLSALSGTFASLDVFDSVFIGAGKAFERTSTLGSEANLSVTRSFYNTSKVNDSNDPGSVTTSEITTIDSTTELGFVDAANNDFRLKHSSPLVDAGNIPGNSFASCIVFPIKDLNGTCRYKDGNGDGTAAYDVGAYEYRRQAPIAQADLSSLSVSAGDAVTFSGADSHDPDPGDQLTYKWSFSDGTTAQNQTVSKVFSAAGSYTGTLTVTDPTGLTDTDTVTVEITKQNELGLKSVTTTVGDRRPTVQIGRPAKASLKRGKLKLLRGTARDDKGILKVQLSVVKTVKHGGKTVCNALTKAGKIRRYKPVRKNCKPRFLLNATGKTNWKLKLKKALTKGLYTITARATDTKNQTATKKIVVKIR